VNELSPAAEPLVSIGIPTYKRLPGLKRALESAQSQDYSNFEIVISDNASTDGTEAYCRAVARTDPRVTYTRQAMNVGPEKNFATALEISRGEYFMWLADDDWIDANYMSSCARFLTANSDFVVAAGYAQYAETDGSNERP
jgi:glycosyltransferase involved in cell wall biosynthesis